MRCVVQRVKYANVFVKDVLISEIKEGFLVLVGVQINDNEDDINYLTRKISNLRIFDDENGKLNLSIKEINGEILLISQFTLLGSVKNGFRPDFTRAEKGEKAKNLIKIFKNSLEENGLKVKEGIFGEIMDIEFVNSGPVTIIIDSKFRDF
ncbi:MAG TPA: D-aminoacyl-tRNA deacylase [Caldisericia bacterium]|nr:D-aminoacyl-tRNA deacylase [Caldisericia bacterium]